MKAQVVLLYNGTVEGNRQIGTWHVASDDAMFVGQKMTGHTVCGIRIVDVSISFLTFLCPEKMTGVGKRCEFCRVIHSLM